MCRAGQECHPTPESHGSFSKVYEKEETVFVAGSWVYFLHITATGTYDYIEGGDVVASSFARGRRL